MAMFASYTAQGPIPTPTAPAKFAPALSCHLGTLVTAYLCPSDTQARYADRLDGGGPGGGRGEEAARRYLQARALRPHDGMAFNQLAVLATHAHNEGVDAAFYYLCRYPPPPSPLLSMQSGLCPALCQCCIQSAAAIR